RAAGGSASARAAGGRVRSSTSPVPRSGAARYLIFILLFVFLQTTILTESFASPSTARFADALARLPNRTSHARHAGRNPPQRRPLTPEPDQDRFRPAADRRARGHRRGARQRAGR